MIPVIQWHIEKYNVSYDDFMFKTATGQMLYAKWVERRFAKLLELSGYPSNFCRVHDLRGQYVDIMHLCNVPVTYISKQVGHRNPKVTFIHYSEILNELPEKANKDMDNLIFGQKENDTDNTEIICDEINI